LLKVIQTVDKTVYFLKHIKIRGFIFLRKADFICDSLENLKNFVVNHRYPIIFQKAGIPSAFKRENFDF